MDPIEDDALEAFAFLDDISCDADVPFVSSVTGVETRRLDSAYWWSNIRQRVRFAEAMETVKRDHRPNAVLELAPHSALQPLVAQCVEDMSPPPVSIPTLMRDRDARIGFLEALGTLFRTGVPLDFAAQYPRPEPIVDLLPGHPRDEQKTVDDKLDDEFFLQQGEYAHGPLVGHRIPGDHLLFEARLSERAFPWLAEHRVHHASIMPAAGYIELILEALGGVPVHFDVIEFLQPCPIPKTPVRLQTSLYRVADSAGEYTFSISTLPYEVDAKSELHCRGKVRLIDVRPEMDAPATLADIDASGYEALRYAADDEIYERFEVILGDTYQYGPQFRNIRRLRREPETGRLLLDVGVDETLWTDARNEGYVSFPPLLDGGLQSFLYDLMLGADRFAIPLRAENVTFLGAPTVPRLVCQLTYPGGKRYEVDDKGQYDVPNGEWVSGRLNFYDDATGALSLHVGKYISFISYPRRVDLPHSKHRIVWQPKYISRRRRDCRSVAGGRDRAIRLCLPPLSAPVTAMCVSATPWSSPAPESRSRPYFSAASSISRLRRRRPSSGWSATMRRARARHTIDAFHAHDAVLRFDCIEPDGRAARPRSSTSLPRRHAADILFLHQR